jgi:hypothetical protein
MRLEMNEVDRIARAYARLTAIKGNVGAKDWWIGSGLIDEYNGALDHLDALWFDVDEFRLPKDRLDYGDTGRPTIETNIFMTKLDALLTYFNLLQQPEQKSAIGFRGPRK